MKIGNLRELYPAIGFVLILFLLILLPKIILQYSPRYYSGDPNFNVEEYKAQAKESMRGNLGSLGIHLDEDDILLPPRVISNATRIILSISSLLTICWCLIGSVYAFTRRNNFPSKNIIWIASAIYIAYTTLFFVLLGLGGAGLG